MKTINDGGPAFPVATEYGEKIESSAGLSIRDYFATHATEDDIRAALDLGESWESRIDRATARFRHADAMLKAREAR